MEMKDRNKLIIENHKGDRILLFIFSPLIAAVMGGLTLFLHEWTPEGQVEKAAKIILFDLFLAFFIFSFICFLWSIFGQDRINRLLLFSYTKVILALQILGIGTFLTLADYYIPLPIGRRHPAAFIATYVDPRFCLQLPSGAHCCTTLAFGYPSPPSGWVWTLPDMRVIISDSTM